MAQETTAARIERLEHAAALIEQTGRDDLDAEAIWIHVRLPRPAEIKFTGGAYVVSFFGVAGSSTNSREDALRSWARAARRKAAKLREA